MTEKRKPVRMCIACRQGKPKEELVRVIKDKDGTVTIDASGKKPGRGAYICATCACVEKAKKIFGKVMRVPMEEELYNELKRIAEKREQ